MRDEFFSATIYSPANLVEMLRYRCHVQKDETVFLYLSNGETNEISLTYGKLDRQARAVAAWLQERKLTGKRILLQYPPGVEFIAAFFGCLYAGSVAVPIYPPRRNRSMQRIEAVVKSAEASAALTTSDILERIQELISESLELKKLTWHASNAMPEGIENAWQFPDISEHTLAFLQYTSGSTGVPKGVALTHGNLLHNSRLINFAFEHTRSSSGVFWLPSYHDMGLIGGILQPIYCGRSNVLMAPLAFLQKPIRWLSAISKYRATTSGGPNFAYDLCTRQITDEQIDALDLSCWKVAFNGAEPVQAETLDQFARRFERCGFRYESFYPCFGLAEATLMVTGGRLRQKPVILPVEADALANGIAKETADENAKVRWLVSSGQNLLDQRTAIVDPETEIECPDCVVGEIWVRGPSMAQGYWNAPDATEYTFRAVVKETGEGPFMRTGDLGFMKDGELFVTGRIKDLIIIHGVNVYPQDIEATMQKVHQALRVNSGGAFMVDDGQSERLVVVQEIDRTFVHEPKAVADLFTAIRKAVAIDHEIAPDAIVLVKAGSIPKTSSGKIQRHQCREEYIAGTLKVFDQWVAPGSPLAKKTFLDKSVTLQLGAPGDRQMAERLRQRRVEAEEKEKRRQIDIPEADAADRQTQVFTLTFEETKEAVLEEVRKVGRERAQGITLETDITELGLDSLERMEILASLEDRFGGQFPESVLPTLYTAQEVVDAVQRYLGGGKTAKQAANQFLPESDEIPREWFRVAEFPEYKALRERLDLASSLDLNRFFDEHESVANDRTIIRGKEYVNFSSYNYVNMSGDPAVTKAAQDAVAKYGTSVSASRLVSGEKPLHRELEREIARFLGTEDAMVMVGGHSTNESVIGHLLNDKDLILMDALSHNSIVQGALLSGARRRPFPHNDLDAAEWILKKRRRQYRRVLIVVEGVYSMDGDYPDLTRLIEIKKRHQCLLMIDEAHSLGVLGKTGRGIGEHCNVNRADVDLWMCTLSKTFASCGGYISGSKELIEYLKFTAPGFVFSVGISPANAGAALAALKLLEQEPQRVEQLRRNSGLFLRLAKERGLDTGLSKDSAVIPIIIGNSLQSLRLSKALFDAGINALPIVHPAVEEKAARLRFFITSAHTEQQIRKTVDVTAEELRKLTDALRAGVKS
ncbi:MAG: aminotransferase class I/II-fold pyridoxal phosphate-dependent enzyme [Planctomycetaceae bacterium]|nr:aminotransferase class I/II-fold pyridoxal phosphate-dependent enzyme [Planctomycetaceae bacterium]